MFTLILFTIAFTITSTLATFGCLARGWRPLDELKQIFELSFSLAMLVTFCYLLFNFDGMALGSVPVMATSLKKIVRTTKIKFDESYEEYTVYQYENKILVGKYFTDDRQDAKDSAKFFKEFEGEGEGEGAEETLLSKKLDNYLITQEGFEAHIEKVIQNLKGTTERLGFRMGAKGLYEYETIGKGDWMDFPTLTERKNKKELLLKQLEEIQANLAELKLTLLS